MATQYQRVSSLQETHTALHRVSGPDGSFAYKYMDGMSRGYVLVLHQFHLRLAFVQGFILINGQMRLKVISQGRTVETLEAVGKESCSLSSASFNFPKESS